MSSQQECNCPRYISNVSIIRYLFLYQQVSQSIKNHEVLNFRSKQDTKHFHYNGKKIELNIVKVYDW